MPFTTVAPQHIYERAQPTCGGEDSLSLIGGRVRPGSQVLDLGTGGGALGRYLVSTLGCTLDGVTYNRAEAALAQDAYRTLRVADLDTCDLTELFAPARYDHVICADVLEHLKHPERVLHACVRLLANGGTLLISVPNAAYAGLIAELLQGEFRYREEGLLDATHLRFFTLTSLLRFLNQHGWRAAAVRSVIKQLDASEFRVAVDDLPPAVARYLLAIPNGLAYQFIIEAHPAARLDEHADKPVAVTTDAEAPPAQARFTAQLFVKHADGYAEQRKLLAYGVIGEANQILSFALPADPNLTGMRLDPADRPGFLNLRDMRILDANGHTVWEWSVAETRLDTQPCHGIVSQPALPTDAGVVVLLTNDDPWFELPLHADLIETLRMGATVQIRLGWPMSADYLALAQQTDRLLSQCTEAKALESEARAERTRLQEENRAQASSLKALEDESQALESRLSQSSLRIQALLKQQAAMSTHLASIENSTIFRVTRPLVRTKMWLDQHLRPDAATMAPAAQKSTPLPRPSTPVDIIVPVYRGLEDTRCCIESVLASTPTTPWRLILINDASPEADVTAWLRECATRDSRITLLENETNLGFVATVNRGMSVSDQHDVLLLNSDAEVANDWLDRIRAAAYSDQRIASVTPFSNNATICSYPRFCAENALPPGLDTAALDTLFASCNPGGISDIPTAVGFCMYIRRACLDEVGLFDVENFGKGYGEENDFCMRAHNAGWRNVLAKDTFVRHAGGVSFGASKRQRELEAGAVMRRLHPGYEALVHKHIGEDPAREARIRVDIARLRAGDVPLILAVTHDRAGGTRRHIEELVRHFAPRARFIMLSPGAGGETLLSRPESDEGFELAFRLPDALDALLGILHDMGVAHVHYHHLLGHPQEVMQLPSLLGVQYDYTAHDFYTICPQISLIDHNDRYCGELGVGQCRDCLRRSPAPDNEDIVSWRERHERFLRGARTVIAPSADTAARLRHYMPGANIRLCPHLDLEGIALPTPSAPRALGADTPLRVAVIGALSKLKGADVLEDVAALAARQKAPLEFHLLGYAYRNLVTQPRASLTVHGPYDEADLDGLLAWLKPDLVWFPAQCPETYSYTLSACLKAGYPVVGTNLGAIGARLGARAWSWVLPWDLTAGEWLSTFETIRTQNFIGATPPTPPISTTGSNGDIGSMWSYRHAYLEGVTARPGAAELPSTTRLWSLRPGRHLGRAAISHGARQAALRSLVRLRSAPLLRGIARHIPLRVQSRIKSWLNR